MARTRVLIREAAIVSYHLVLCVWIYVLDDPHELCHGDNIMMSEVGGLSEESGSGLLPAISFDITCLEKHTHNEIM